MTLEEHKIEVEKLNKLENELTNHICLTDNQDLYDIYLKWKNQRNVCNQGFVSVTESILKTEQHAPQGNLP